MIGLKIREVVFHTRVQKLLPDGSKVFEWKDITTKDCFSGKRVLIFSLPGAFTPTCSTYQLPGFEKMYGDFLCEGIEEIYCISVNDSFVMNAWGKTLDINNVKLLPDGSGEFTRKIGMLVHKDNLGFGLRSWRYAAVVNDMIIQHWFEEKGFSDNCTTDPYEISSPENVLKHLKAINNK
ncbi:MAG: peroxiredoxin [Candidatus Liberibacter europaeus]|uniref:Glutathione-dependent peroxiredoxin n=1 Tax=Candidatus Liberibacter europaeus TaxID=744859 RepID=A0A2T4VXX6_9HYPH|nr:peroxiredoxin [Candidatus Liberibacter europaeus]PTL86620.1 MAG: peroxiredoxin [Candidatus Liberibacter europaeus]